MCTQLVHSLSQHAGFSESQSQLSAQQDQCLFLTNIQAQQRQAYYTQLLPSILGGQNEWLPLQSLLAHPMMLKWSDALSVLSQIMTEKSDSPFRQQQQLGLDQDDFAGRNVSLVRNEFDPSELPTEMCSGLPLPRVILINYNHARIKTRGSRLFALPLPGKPASTYLTIHIYDEFSRRHPCEWKGG